MSRLDEAMRRQNARRDNGPGAAESQRLFAPAWTVSSPETGAAEAATADLADLAESVLTPQVLAEPEPPNGTLRLASGFRAQFAAGPDGDPHLVEQFRRLAATLHHARQTNGLRSVLVTSALPGDGKTMTALNLALVLGESYRYRVLLLDADLRRPSIANIVSFGSGSGLSEALRSPTDQKLALIQLTPRLTLLPAGQPTSNSIEALTSPRMRQILDEAQTRFDWIVVDSPPVSPTTDARLLAHMVDGTLFVVHAGQTQCPDVQRAIEALGREQILGVVLNGVQKNDIESYYYYGGDAPGEVKG